MTVYSTPMPRIAAIQIHYWMEFDASYKLPVLFTNGFIVSAQASMSTQEVDTPSSGETGIIQN